MENSKILLDHAIYALSSTSIASNQWSIGGGTVLANYFNHRISKDIDVFINDAQCLTELSPRVNDECDNALDYDEMSNFISSWDAILNGGRDFVGKEIDICQRFIDELKSKIK